VEPLGYLAFISLVRGAAVVITDSGGIQEETTILGVPCLTVRPNTERPITISHGTNRLVEPEEVAAGVAAILAVRPRGRRSRLRCGTATPASGSPTSSGLGSGAGGTGDPQLGARHPRVRDVLRRLRAAWWALLGRQATTAGSGNRLYPTSFQVRPAPLPIAEEWTDPPARPAPFRRVEAIADDPPRRYDVELFEALNAEYASHPIVTDAPKYDPVSIAERSRRRIATVHDRIDLRGRTVLEVGCGSGYEVWHLAHQLGSDAWGIDIAEREGWRTCAAIASTWSPPTWPTRRCSRPRSSTGRCRSRSGSTSPIRSRRSPSWPGSCRPGGLAWIRANLYRGPTASHRYRDVFFPFPHLLFRTT
jgi:hypothetical protein